MRRRSEVWGDDASERDADATVAELSGDAGGPASRRWHQSIAIVPLKAVVAFLARNGKRIGVAIGGGLLVLIGVALLVLPGPGWLFIFLGLGVLATEFVWAERMLMKAKAKAQEAKDKVADRRQARARRRAERRTGTTDARPAKPGPPNARPAKPRPPNALRSDSGTVSRGDPAADDAVGE
jgi:uncharacterized protein (TIGR02611 family)